MDMIVTIKPQHFEKAAARYKTYQANKGDLTDDVFFATFNPLSLAIAELAEVEENYVNALIGIREETQKLEVAVVIYHGETNRMAFYKGTENLLEFLSSFTFDIITTSTLTGGLIFRKVEKI